MKQRRVTIKQVAAEAGLSITTIPSVRAPPDDVGRFHAYYRREKTQKAVHEATEENPAPWDLPGVNLTGDDNYVILDAAGGQGHYAGCSVQEHFGLWSMYRFHIEDGALHHVTEGVHRTRPRQRPGQRLLLRRLLVPDRQARRPRRTGPYGAQASPALARARPVRRMSRT
jgi:hypothetical protein